MDTGTLPAQLCFGKVLHTRLRPTRHAFGYEVYFVRLPLRAMAQQTHTTPRFFSLDKFNLLSFHAQDHGDGKQALLPWIETLLKQEGIHDADGEIWLQAFPRVLGYVFNPVSFWFCHKKDGSLRAVLAEVCNTFGEKHCYLLDTGTAMPYGVELIARKIFHVSPFCAVEGLYRFHFMHATREENGATVERHIACIDHDDIDGPLILTSISGTAQPLSDASVARAFFTYPLMTLGVIVRIHWQALKLWRKRMPFFSKPTPPTSELSR